MDSEENSSASFIPEHLQKIPNVIESGETRHKWKLVRNAASFTLIINFPAKTDKAKGQGQGNQPPLKKRASGVLACQHKEKKQKASSDVRLADHPKPKKKKTPSRVARDRRRRREFWKRMKVARQLRAENLAAHYTRLQETRMLPVHNLLRSVTRRIPSAVWIVTPRNRGGLAVRSHQWSDIQRNLGAWIVHP